MPFTISHLPPPCQPVGQLRTHLTLLFILQHREQLPSERHTIRRFFPTGAGLRAALDAYATISTTSSTAGRMQLLPSQKIDERYTMQDFINRVEALNLFGPPVPDLDDPGVPPMPSYDEANHSLAA